MSDAPWYQTFFGSDYLRIYSPFLPAARTAREVESIIRLLNLDPGSGLLDLCCGQGRHTVPLAQYGYKMTGLDLSPALLQVAQTEAQQHDVDIRWVQSDMRTIPFQQTFDAIINLFTSFGYLENDDEDLRVLQQVQQALKPGGLFLLETVHQARVLRSFSPYGIFRYDDGLIVLEERRIDLQTSRNEIQLTMLHADGRRAEQHHSMRIYTPAELIHMLESAGLQVQACYGDLDRNALTLDSRLVVIGKKVQQSPSGKAQNTL